jgi:D-alanyl-D-alanine carboxypeptidase
VLYAQESPSAIAASTILNSRLGNSDAQSFCLQTNDGKLEGARVNQKQRIASVTKLFTSFVSLNTIPQDYRWQTTFTMAGSRLHISGGMDPWFEEEKMLALLAELKARGVTHLREVTFDENFWFEDGEPGTHHNLTPSETAANLALYFSKSGRLSANILARRAASEKEMSEDGLSIPLASSGIPTDEIHFSNNNPIQEAGAIQLVHKSRTLLSTLKAMNVFSKNKVARNLWNFVATQKDPLQILSAAGLPMDELSLHNGSGLSTPSNEGRLDNEASCHAVMELLVALENLSHDWQLPLQNMVGVGIDPGGHLEDRFVAEPVVKNALIAKTGTLGNTSALAGWLLGRENVRFVLLNETRETLPARNAQDAFLISLLHNDYGPARPLNYQPGSFFALEEKFFN